MSQKSSTLPSIAVCLTSFNGVRWLPEQIASIYSQSGVVLTVFVSVDVSSDGTEKWIDQAAGRDSRIKVLPHGRHFGGAAQNFFRLLHDINFSEFDYVCFADQDDIWLPEKLLRAHQTLSITNADAYSSNVFAFWENGRKTLIEKSQPQVKWDFLFEAAGPGCTYVMKKELACAIQDLVKSRWDEVQEVGLHDWFSYAFARANGYRWVIDDFAGMLYRQHENNQVGANSGWRAFIQRADKVLSGWGLAQSALIARLVGLNDDPFVLRWAGGSRLGLLYLTLRAWQCRRRVRDKFIFALSCLVLSVTRRVVDEAAKLKKLMLVELNEINFDVVDFYLGTGSSLPGFSKVMNEDLIITKAESKFEELEPWIQWPSVHTGKVYDDHKVFRLGDFVNSKEKQFFEKVEKAGFRVGAVGPMNASNNLKKPEYFIPDPWTQTACDNSFLSRRITAAIGQAVNDNSASKLTIKSVINLIIAFIALVNPRRYLSMVKYALAALGKPWRKALFLDMILYEIHKTLYGRKKPNFSTLFLNAGAHIQHHYFFNSPFVDSPELQNPSWYIGKNEDPILEMLKVYDSMLTDLLNLSDTEVIIATGLSQKPYEQLKFYYRPKDHKSFLNDIGIVFTDVVPRMTRDFLISFDSDDQALAAETQLSSILVDNEVRLFEEIDNRGKTIFAVLTYPSEITKETTISASGQHLSLSDLVTFVAIKNGEHQSKGFAYFSDGVSKFAPPQGSHVSKIHNTVLQFFGFRS